MVRKRLELRISVPMLSLLAAVGWLCVVNGLVVDSGDVDTKDLSKNQRIDPNVLIWSSNRCQELGYGDMFDYCAELEFCVGGGDDDRGWRHRRRERRRRGLLRRGNMDEEDEEEEYGSMSHFQTKVEEVGQDLHGELDEEEVTELEYEEEEEGAEADISSESAVAEDLYSPRVGRVARYGWRVRGHSECVWPGPLIRMERGRSYGLLVSNSVEGEVTNLHTHGLHVAGHGNADDVTRRIGAGDVLLYNYTIPAHHMGGTHWYHSHAHPHTEKQVTGGAFGMLVVEDGENVMDGRETDDEAVRRFLNNEQLLVLSNNNRDPKIHDWLASVLNPHHKEQGGRHNLDDDAQELLLHPDQWYRLRVLVVNSDPWADMETVSFDGERCEVRTVAHDGVFRFRVPAEQPQSDHLLTLSSRLDVAIQCRSGPPVDIQVNGQTVAQIALTEEQPPNEDFPVSPFVDINSPWSSRRPPYLADHRNHDNDDADDPIHRWAVHMDEININGHTYSATTPLCDRKGRDFQYGVLQEWTVRTSSHPWHLHGQAFQISGDDNDCGRAHDTGEYYDTLAADSKCKVRFRFLDVTGRTTLHCHVYRHGDSGSMAFVNVIGATPELQQPEEPRVHTCVSDPQGNCDPVLQGDMCPGANDEDEDGEQGRGGYYYDF